jgi:multiple sugar transport system substrate-binding protein
MTKRNWALSLVAVGAVVSLAGCAGGGGSGGDDSDGLTMLIGSSGDAETSAVQAAADAWAADNDTTVEVVAAADLTQELAQGFAGDNPPDLFYMSWDQFQTYASNGYLEDYAADLPNAGDFYPNLEETFTYDGTFTCAPKDFSTLGLIVNTDLWAAAGLTEADVPTDWDSLRQVAQTLTTGDVVGLSMGQEYARVGVFMNQAGGQLVNDDQTEATADSAENAEGLAYVQQLHADGLLRWPAEIDSGWSGEALGSGRAAMVIEGPWIKGIQTDFPDTNYAAYELPAGPGGQSTFTFTNCWGIPATGGDTAQAQSLVEYLTGDDQQLEFADAFGVIPSTEAAAATYAETYPENASFVAGQDYAVTPVNFAGSADVVTDFNSQLQALGDTDDPSALLSSFNDSLQAALDEANG